MRGVVNDLNRARGLVAIEVGEETNDFTIAEILGDVDDFAVGDIVRGDLRSNGGETWQNVTQRRRVRVFVQVIGATPSSRDIHMGRHRG
jgi:hypothetical protein